jgi:LemA protein
MPSTSNKEIRMSPWMILAIVAAVLAMSAVGIYNSLVTLRQRYKNAFAQIDVQLKRRYDLIPNLVETAKGYLKHERETLEAVIKARNLALSASQQAGAAVGQPDAMHSLGQAEGQLNGALARLMVVVERYPELKADKNMAMLQEEITATENKVAFARQAYNDAATAYNTKREVFPANLFAGAFGFQPATLFEVTQAAEREAPRVQF